MKFDQIIEIYTIVYQYHYKDNIHIHLFVLQSFRIIHSEFLFLYLF